MEPMCVTAAPTNPIPHAFHPLSDAEITFLTAYRRLLEADRLKVGTIVGAMLGFSGPFELSQSRQLR